MKKGVISVNSNAEKTIIAMTISVVLAIIFDGKKKKPAKRKSFAQRVSKDCDCTLYSGWAHVS